MENLKKTKMENLKKAVSKVITTAMVVDQKLEDGKITMPEGMTIAVSAVGWIWIFKNFRKVIEDFKALDEEGVATLIETIKSELDLRNDSAEAVVEQALEIIIRLAAVMVATRPVAE
ncbi:MAG TPA: hypothetical protein PLC85_11060 [Smithellaceae bacterium]|nr:hypothetical protein [Smithellaceae bacterium]